MVIALIAALVPFAAVLIFLHHSKKSRVVRLGGGRAAAAATAGKHATKPTPLRSPPLSSRRVIDGDVTSGR